MRRHVKLNQLQSDGSRLIDHLQALVEQLGEAFTWPDETPLPEIPDEFFYVWDYYWDLRQGISQGVNGPNPVSYAEIQAWINLADIELSWQELRFLRLLDAQFLISTGEHLKKTTAQNKNRQPKATRPAVRSAPRRSPRRR